MSSKGALILVSVDTEAVRSVLRGLDRKTERSFEKGIKADIRTGKKPSGRKGAGSYTVKNAGFKRQCAFGYLEHLPESSQKVRL